jgi:hypothetical protein
MAPAQMADLSCGACDELARRTTPGGYLPDTLGYNKQVNAAEACHAQVRI